MSYMSKKPKRRLKKPVTLLSGLILSIALVVVGANLLAKIPSNKPLSVDDVVEVSVREEGKLLNEPLQYPKKFYYDSGIDIPYPTDGVKGLYLSAHGFANTTMRTRNFNLIKKTNLNSVVIDVKDDWGAVLFDFESDNPLVVENTRSVMNAKDALKMLEAEQIYPIARIVTFKDSSFAKKHPEHAFRKSDGTPWANNRGENFINPFKQEVWDYTIAVAVEAAKAGFKEIQFDYIRFAENFSYYEPNLSYEMGKYAGVDKPISELRIQVINDFIEYSKQVLQPYGVKVGIDIFGYTATVVEDSDIGQNFLQMAERGDVVSSMIYPSHWGNGYFGLRVPDMEPYEVV
ncbi:MAG TPA: putative glycoside hydrolase, partial [Erysipelothrix sp.]|nr:putative glycoside hydrolase [Erysipelothrix sp.]